MGCIRRRQTVLWGSCRYFFFSSRRRHTRYWRDWSSDVCSSDLATRGRRRPRVAGSRPGAPAARAGQPPPRGTVGGAERCGDRKSVVEGKSVDLGGRRIIKKKVKKWKSYVAYLSKVTWTIITDSD